MKMYGHIQPTRSFINRNTNLSIIIIIITFLKRQPANYSPIYYRITRLIVFYMKLKTNVKGNYEGINGHI